MTEKCRYRNGGVIVKYSIKEQRCEHPRPVLYDEFTIAVQAAARLARASGDVVEVLENRFTLIDVDVVDEIHPTDTSHPAIEDC